MFFNERLKKLRKESGLTQASLAKQLNIKPVNISSYELGNSTPSNEILVKISKIFNVSTDYLLGKTDDRYFGLSEEQKELTIDQALDNVMSYNGEPISDNDRQVLKRIFEGYLAKKD